MYLLNPRQSATPTSGKQSAVIRKGKMLFGRPKGDAQDWRPTDDYVGQKEQTLHAPFAFHPEQDRVSRLQLSSTTSPALAEAVSHVNLSGETSQQFEYLVNKTILKEENKELSTQANRLNKLNALCK